MKNNRTVVDANTETLRCLVCGDEIPIPLGVVPWVIKVMDAFMGAHSPKEHTGQRTFFSTPKVKP
jgi:hypothetical protein